jgi:hypothetical protein
VNAAGPIDSFNVVTLTVLMCSTASTHIAPDRQLMHFCGRSRPGKPAVAGRAARGPGQAGFHVTEFDEKTYTF